jgi:Periplasmic component of the Tol biopolymer transport system
MIFTYRRIALLAGAVGVGTGALAQHPAPTVAVVAVPPLSTPDDKPTSAGGTLSIAWQASRLIARDLGTTAEIMALPPTQKDYYSYPEVTAPTFSKWRSKGAKILITGFVQARADQRITFGCYAYDVDKGREVARKGFVVAPDEWQRAAHKCSGLAYTAVTGAPSIFDTRIAYVAESGPAAARVKRLAIVDSDGTNHRYLSAGESMALTPRLSPDGRQIAYVSFLTGTPHVRIRDVDGTNDRALLQPGTLSFAPRFSPDGKRIVFSMTMNGNTDIYSASIDGSAPVRLTTSPGVDTDASFAPDGNRIVFESDRSGSQQLYLMDAHDGSAQRRLTFGGAAYAAPDWSPDGNWIAFTRRDPGGRRVGVLKRDGSGEQLLSAGPGDEGASWAASSRELVFQRSDPAGNSSLLRVSLDGSEPRSVVLPQGGSDPDWSGVAN